jgi:hypothetical protein
MTDKTETRTINGDLFQRVQDMQRSWLDRLRELQQIESDYGTKLLHAKSPAEATAICGEWTARRLETIAANHQSLTAAWLELASDVVHSTSAMAAKTFGH